MATDFRFLLIYATSLLVLVIPRSHFHFLMLEIPRLSQFPEDVGEGDEEEELVDKPGTTNGAVLQQIFLSVPDELWFLATLPMITVPNFFP